MALTQDGREYMAIGAQENFLRIRLKGTSKTGIDEENWVSPEIQNLLLTDWSYSSGSSTTTLNLNKTPSFLIEPVAPITPITIKSVQILDTDLNILLEKDFSGGPYVYNGSGTFTVSSVSITLTST